MVQRKTVLYEKIVANQGNRIKGRIKEIQTPENRSLDSKKGEERKEAKLFCAGQGGAVHIQLIAIGDNLTGAAGEAGDIGVGGQCPGVVQGWDMDVPPFPGMAGGVLLLSAKAAEKQLAVSAAAVIIERVRFIIQFLLEWDVFLF